VPVANVDEVDGIGGQAAGPVDQLRQRPRQRLGPEQAGRFGVADVQQVGQRIVWADGVDEIALEALRDKDSRHLRCGQKEPTDRLSWPIAGIGRIVSPRSIAEFDGEWGWNMGEPEQAGVVASPGRKSRADRAPVILTPDRRVWVFVSSTLGEPAGTASPLRDEPGSMPFAMRMAQLAGNTQARDLGQPVDGLCGGELQTHRACRPHLKIYGGPATSRPSPQT
jgi:hypothetical protein